ncbi:MAG: phosphohistidine phosphatase SixA [Chthoniobacteraceae bacterium]|nr:phosphohistidine phosphatase SixA [Chthoniobacteraceae bacterium]
MQLWLLRHADAVSTAALDDARPLSEKGIQQARRVARFCKERGLQPSLILSSPFLRTEQTARTVAQALHAELISCAFLASGMLPEAAMEELRAYRRFETLLLVGHEPDLSALAGALLGTGKRGALRMRKAALAGLDIGSLTPGGARLDFLIPAKLMGKE